MENNLSMKIIYYKKKLKLTNEAIAEKTGLPVGTISRIASGQTKEPTLRTLRLIAKAFNCTVDDLQGGESIEPYYLDSKTAEMAQELHDNPEMRILFDASKKLSPEEIKIVIDVANGLKKNH